MAIVFGFAVASVLSWRSEIDASRRSCGAVLPSASQKIFDDVPDSGALDPCGSPQPFPAGKGRFTQVPLDNAGAYRRNDWAGTRSLQGKNDPQVFRLLSELSSSVLSATISLCWLNCAVSKLTGHHIRRCGWRSCSLSRFHSKKNVPSKDPNEGI